MYPPVFAIAAADPTVNSLLTAGGKTRFWPFGKAPQNEPRPYAVWQTVYGNPVNSLACMPGEDLYGVQVDAYAKDVSDARTVAEALRNAFESTYNHIVSYNGEDWEQATGLWRVSFTAEFWTERSS